MQTLLSLVPEHNQIAVCHLPPLPPSHQPAPFRSLDLDLALPAVVSTRTCHWAAVFVYRDPHFHILGALASDHMWATGRDCGSFGQLSFLGPCCSPQLSQAGTEDSASSLGPQ